MQINADQRKEDRASRGALFFQIREIRVNQRLMNLIYEPRKPFRQLLGPEDVTEFAWMETVRAKEVITSVRLDLKWYVHNSLHLFRDSDRGLAQGRRPCS